MKRDLIIGTGAVLFIAGICFGLTSTRHLQPPPPTPAFAGHGQSTPLPGKVILRVNGHPVTDKEFELFVQSLPEQMQSMATTDLGRRQIADQIVRMKVLEDEARKMGAENDPEVAMKLDFGRTNAYDEFAVRKLAAQGNEAQMRTEYERNKSRLLATELRHILIAYQGSEIPARNGQAPPLGMAMERAKQIERQLRNGADFQQLARQLSDDQASAVNGGAIGVLPPQAIPPQLQNVIEGLQPGQFSPPIKSEYGIHIFQVASRRPQTFEEVRPLLQRQVQQSAVTGALERLQRAAKVDYDQAFFAQRTMPRG